VKLVAPHLWSVPFWQLQTTKLTHNKTLICIKTVSPITYTTLKHLQLPISLYAERKRGGLFRHPKPYFPTRSSHRFSRNSVIALG